jgi:GT2 family glycosyltransferase/glycosyltransferase involved in cell wall biosynthesis
MIPPVPVPTRPVREDWDKVKPAPSEEAEVDVVVPVYSGADVTLRCLHRVLSAAQTTRFELIVINDASPDPELVRALDELAGRGLFRLIHHVENIGFVRTANAGMRLNPGRDVVLLNSDAEVFGNWLDRLRSTALREAATATVTPISNNATICSYPNFLEDNPYPLEMGYEDLDTLAQTVNAGKSVAAPTAVGFCMYIKRACLDAIGLFDETVFGRGYGEENDLSQRAINAGWKNVIATDVFVRHWGSASFQGERTFRVRNAMETMRSRHPRYLADIKKFIDADPLSRARARLDLARLMRLRRQQNVLLVIHARGGGTERHVGEDIERLRTEGKGVFLMRPQPDGRHVAISHPEVAALPNLRQTTLNDRAILLDLFRNLGITEVHVHHLIDFERDAPAALLHILRDLGASLRVMVHDYTSICPRVNLVDTAGVYCGEPPQSACRVCIARNGTDFGKVDISAWRAMYRELFLAADEILVPDRDVSQRLARYFPDVHLRVQPHEANLKPPPKPTPRLRQPELRLRIVVIGAISKIKGYDVLLACAQDARKRALPLDFIVLGYSLNDAPLLREGVVITGRYLDSRADQQLVELEPDCVWLPYVWPETYSYTLSIALRCGFPVFAFDLGAIASRLRSMGQDDHLKPLALAWNPSELNRRFMAHRELLLQQESVTQELGQLWPAALTDNPFPESFAHTLAAVESAGLPVSEIGPLGRVAGPVVTVRPRRER